jgi:hypothetical protein
MALFSEFRTTPYTFLRLDSKSAGFVIEEEYEAVGIVKLRSAVSGTQDGETNTSTTTVHVKPSETFISDVSGELKGNGVRIEGVEYRIVDQSQGKDFDTGVVEFYKITLDKLMVSAWPSDLPLN